MRLKHYTRIITLLAGETEKEAYFPTFDDPVVGVATKQIGTDPIDTNENLVVLDGSLEVLQPIDLAFTDVRGKGSVLDAIMPLSIQKPSEIRAKITTNEDGGAAADRVVKVYVFYAEGTDPGQLVKLKDFL